MGIWVSGTGDGPFNMPTGIAIDPVGNVYVLDSGNYQIEKFANDGTFLIKWFAGKGVSGVGIGSYICQMCPSTLLDMFISHKL